MKNNTFFTYSTLSDKTIELCELCNKELEFYYSDLVEDEIERHKITVDFDALTQNDAPMLLLSTRNSNYNSDNHNLEIEGQIDIQHPDCFFGEETGIAYKNSILGLAVLWVSKSSSQRGILSIAELKYQTNPVSFPYLIKFESGMIRGIIDLSVVLYLKQSAKGLNANFADVPGTILGTLFEQQVSIDGTGSLFPIVVYEKQDDPLWTIEYNSEDPKEDLFATDNLAIKINSAHKYYPQLKMDAGGIADSVLLREIIANGLAMLINKVKENLSDWEEIMHGESSNGSIGAAVHYFVTTFEWNTDSIDELSFSIRKTFDSLLK